MAQKKFPKQLSFWMNINDYDALQKFLLEDERSMASFLRFAIMKELNSDIPDINQILALGYIDKKAQKQVNITIADNEFSAIKEYLKNNGLAASTFYRYLIKRELHRLETNYKEKTQIYNKEKNQTWDLD